LHTTILKMCKEINTYFKSILGNLMTKAIKCWLIIENTRAHSSATQAGLQYASTKFKAFQTIYKINENELIAATVTSKTMMYFQLFLALPLDPAGGSAPDPRYRLALCARHVIPHCLEEITATGMDSSLGTGFTLHGGGTSASCKKLAETTLADRSGCAINHSYTTLHADLSFLSKVRRG